MKRLISVDRPVESLPDQTPFVDKIRDCGQPIDFLLVLVVPAVLVAVFQLPQETRRGLAFSYDDPTVLTAFTANYVHLTGIHLLSNLITYLLLVGVTYLLALSNSNRPRFYTAFIWVLLVLPIPLSYLNLAVPRLGIGFGFSGLNMALLGIVLIEFADYLNTYFTSDFGVENSPTFFFIFMVFVAMPHVDTRLGLSVVAVSLVLTVVYSGGFLFSYRPSVASFRKSLGKQGYFELVVIVILLCPAIVATAFPQVSVMRTSVINLYAHLVGFCLGFISFYIWMMVTTSANLLDGLPIVR